VSLTVIPVVVGIPSFSQVFRMPWKWSVCGWLLSVSSSVTSMSFASVVRGTGPGTLGIPSSTWNAHTFGSSTGPPIESGGWTSWRVGGVYSVTAPPCSSAWTPSGEPVVGNEAVFVVCCCTVVVTAPWSADVEQLAVLATAAATPVSA
jgi:hypothetical protein